MNPELKTFELAKIYESQGYYKDAADIYSFLYEQNPSNEIKAGIHRMEKHIKKGDPYHSPEKNIARLFEQWLMLMVLKQRLGHFKKIKSRLV